MIYQYKCNRCNTEMEVERSIHDPERAPTCIDCHGTMARVWTSFAFKPAPGMYSHDNQK